MINYQEASTFFTPKSFLMKLNFQNEKKPKQQEGFQKYMQIAIHNLVDLKLFFVGIRSKKQHKLIQL